MLEVRNLSVVYGQHRALENVSVQVAPGEIVVILGANGAGKSTLLRAISGICEGQHSGTVEMDHHAILGISSDKIVERGIALVPEGRGIFGDLSVRENLVLGAYSARARADETANMDRVLSLFPKLRERLTQVARTMSGGEQQMVAIGRAMMSNPAILMLDEPSLGLSPLLCKELFQNLHEVRKSGIGILLVEQNAKQSLAIADRGYLLENAHITHEDSAQNLMNDPAVQSAYLGKGAASPAQKQTVKQVVKHAPATRQNPAPDLANITAAALASVKKTAAPTWVASTPSKPKLTPPPLPPRTTLQAPPPPRPQAGPATNSADALLGFSVSDLVSKASKTQRQSVTPARLSPPQSNPRPAQPVAKTGDLAEALQEIEAAAKAAENRGKREFRTYSRKDYRPQTESFRNRAGRRK